MWQSAPQATSQLVPFSQRKSQPSPAHSAEQEATPRHEGSHPARAPQSCRQRSPPTQAHEPPSSQSSSSPQAGEATSASTANVMSQRLMFGKDRPNIALRPRTPTLLGPER